MFIRITLLTVGLLLGLGQTSVAAKKKPPKPAVKPRFDDPEIPFRMAPMPPASRSIAVSVLPDLHLAFDTENARTHTVWTGKGLHLLGPQYSYSKRPFISTNDANVAWTMPPWSPWSEDQPTSEPSPISTRYRAISTKGGRTAFHYDLLLANGDDVLVRETPRGVHTAGRSWLIREIEIGPAKEDLWFAVHSEFGVTPAITADGFQFPGRLMTTVAGHREGDLSRQSFAADYTEEVYTEKGAEEGNPTVRRKGRLHTVWLRIRSHTSPQTISLATYAGADTPPADHARKVLEHSSRPKPDAPPAVLSAHSGFVFSRASTKSYRVEPFPLPKELELLVTGMDFLPNGDLAVSTWPGDICIVRQPASPRTSTATYTRFATGLCEPMGLVVKDGEIYVGMKNELARVSDTDGNGRADLVERVRADWSYTGHYNAFSYGPVLDRNGDFVLANAGHSGRWDARYTGWAFRVAANGRKTTPICSGLREPNGLGVFGPERDIFVTDNQGSWIGECRLDHIAPGKFHGHPSGWPAKREDYGKPGKMDPPAVWFPYTLAKSTSDIAEIPEGFGPFTGQLLVGDFQNALVMRVMLEKVGGEYQGAVWPFLKNFSAGVNRLAFGPDKRLYVGGCQRTWASIAPQEAALDRVSFTGQAPFEIKSVHARPDGFELEFTEPVDPDTAGDPASYDMLQYTLLYRQKYGSPQIDHAGKENSATAIDVTGATVFGQNRKVRLIVSGWKTGFVTMVRGLDVRSARGEKLAHNTFWYTLNQMPND